MSETSTIPSTTQRDTDTENEKDLSHLPAPEAAKLRWQSKYPGKSPEVPTTVRSLDDGVFVDALATQPFTAPSTGAASVQDAGMTVESATATATVEPDTATAVTVPTGIQDTQPESSRYTLGTFLGGIYTAVKDTIHWAYEHPAESAAIVAGVATAAAAAYKAYQTEYDWHRSETKAGDTSAVVLSTAGDEIEAKTDDIWSKAKGLWKGGLGSAWKNGWKDGLDADAGSTGVSRWWGASRGPVVDVTVPAGSTVHLSGV